MQPLENKISRFLWSYISVFNSRSPWSPTILNTQREHLSKSHPEELFLHLEHSSVNVITKLKTYLIPTLNISFSSAIPTPDHPLSRRIFFGSWFLAVLFLLQSVECNLRAYLIAVDYDQAIDSEQDILDLGRRLFLPNGTFFAQVYKEAGIKSYP